MTWVSLNLWADEEQRIRQCLAEALQQLIDKQLILSTHEEKPITGILRPLLKKVCKHKKLNWTFHSEAPSFEKQRTRRVIDDTWYKHPANVPEHTSAGGIVARIENERVYIALVGEKGLSQFALPKGHVEAGETLEQAAVREIEEEAGFTQLTLLAPLGIKERLDFSKKAWKRTHYFGKSQPN